MEINILKNQKFTAANDRASLLDVYYPKKAAKLPLVIFAHGFKGFKDWGTFPLIFKYLAEQSFAVLSFNFSHNGGTIEQPIDFPDLEAFSQNTYSKELMDLNAVFNWVMENEGKNIPAINIDEVNILGHSRGGAMAMLHAARNSNISKVATWAAVADLKARLPKASALEEWKKNGTRMIQNSRTKQEMPQLYTFVEDLYRNEDLLDIQKQVSKLRIPQLIVHGTVDESVDSANAHKLLKWNPKAELLLINGAGHTFGGKHPYTEEKLPIYTIEALDATVKFFKT